MTNPLCQAALSYVGAGLSVIPTSLQTKAPVCEWKLYQSHLPTEPEIKKWFGKNKAMGIITGAVSGNLEIQDFDNRAELFSTWAEIVNREAPGLLERLVIQKSKSDGRHASYRCSEGEIPGNTKLAQRGVDVTASVLEKLGELGVDPQNENSVKKVLPSIEVEISGKKYVPRLIEGKFTVIVTLIETRGEGGQFLAHPTPGYEPLQRDFLHIPTIRPEERQILINAARALNEYIDRAKVEGFGYRLPKEARRPGDDFNERGDVTEVLARHRWEPVGARGAYQHYRRPGKDRGQSASLIDGKWFYVFSSNASPFESETTYSPFAVFALLECDGDFTKAASVLAKIGYGNREFTSATGGDWPEPEPLRRTPEPGEPFPVEALGGVLAPAALAMYEIIKAPLAVCGQSALAGANLAVQGHADVVIDGRYIPVSEFFLSVAQSGERKSAADRAALAPVDSHQRSLLESYNQDFFQYDRELALWKRDQDEALKKKDSKARRTALEALQDPPSAPPYPQLTTQEPTYEGLTKLLRGWPSVGLFSDEAGRFFGGHAMNQDNRLKTLAGLSALWDGSPLSRTRAGDGSVTLYGRRCCAHLLMQPLVAENILGDPLAHDQGFLSRCLVVAPESMLGEQLYVAQDLNQNAVYGRYCAALTSILQTNLPFKVDPETGKNTNELVPRVIFVTPDGKTVWVRFHDWIQSHLRQDGIFRPISGIAAKAAEHALRLAATLTLVEDLSAKAISLEHVKNGITLSRFYLTEALRLFHAANTDPDLIITESV